MIGRGAILAVMALGVGATGLPQPDDRPPWLVWNASASVPIGLYAVARITGVHASDLVVVRPPEPVARFLADGGYLPRGVPLLKHVAAVAGQTVCRIGRSVTVDAIEIGEARERDGRGRSLPVWQGCHAIAKGDVFLMNPRSCSTLLDGRYFGPLPAASIIGRAIPLWVNQTEEDE